MDKRFEKKFVVALFFFIMLIYCIPVGADIICYIESAETRTDGRKVLVTCEKEISSLLASPAGFAVSVNGINNPLTAVELNTANNKIIELTFTNRITNINDIINLSYTPGTITAIDGSPLNGVTNMPVINKYILSDVNLSEVSTNIGTLSPSFAPQTTEYTVTLNTLDTSINITATPADSAASVKINNQGLGVGSQSISVPISAGTKAVSVVVTGRDGFSKKTYTINVVRPAELTALSISSGLLSPTFNKNTLNYTASVTDRTTSLNVIASVEAGAELYINGALQNSGVAKTVPLNVGFNTITIQTKTAGLSRTYQIVVTRNASNVNLSGLSTDFGSLLPNFSPNTTSYTVTLNRLEDTIGISAQPADAGASIKINGQAVGSNTTVAVPINAGNTSISIVVTGWDGVTMKTYTITVTRPAGLSILSTNSGTLSPSFDKNTINYTVDVSYTVSSLNVMAILENTTISELYLNGVKHISGLPKEYSLTIGANIIQIDVKMGSIISTYIITVNRNEYTLPTLNIFNPTTGQPLLEGHKVPKSDNAFTFGLKVKQEADLVEKAMLTELYIGIADDVYQKVVDFTVNGVLNTKGEFLANNGEDYIITLNKALLIPAYVNDFKIKVITKDSLDGEGVKELSLNHFAYILADWSLDSIKDSIANDSSGNCYNGIIQGSTLTKGIVNYAHYFDGEDDYISIPKSSFNNLTDWSFEAWVKPEAPGYIYSEGNPLETMVIEMKDDNSLSISTSHEGRTENWNRFNTGANILTRNEWNHIVITLANGTADSGIIKCYVNGEYVKSGTLGSEYNQNSKYAAAIGGNIGVRCGQSLYPFKGFIDEVTLYGSSLTESEVEKEYHETLFLENIRITNRHNNENSHPCTFGTHFNKIEFELKKRVNELALELDLPSNIEVVHIEKIIYNGAQIENVNVTVENNKLILNNQQTLTPGDYCIEFLLSIGQQLIVKTKSYSDENRVTTNYESEEFEFEFMDF